MKIEKLTYLNFDQNTYLISTDNGYIVIDPGYNFEKVVDRIKDGNIRAILLTHYHFDHVAHLNELCEKYNTKAYIHEFDYSFLLEDTLSEWAGLPKLTIEKKYILTFTDNINNLPEVQMIHAPGHTEGSTLFKIENNLFTGDVLFKYGSGRVDLKGGNPLKQVKSLDFILKMDDELIVHPGHGENAIMKDIK